MDFTLGLITGMYAVVAVIVFYVVYVIEVKLDLPAIVNGNNNNNNNNSNSNNNNSINNEQLADISQTRLRSLIETIIAETLRSGSNSLLLNPPSGAVSEISLDTRSNGQLSGFSNGGSNSKRRHRTEHYFEPKIYQDLLATAVLNKIADKEGNNRLISESTPDLSAHNIDENYNAEALSTTSGSSIEPRSDCSLTDHELTGKAEAHAGSQLDVERESVLSDYIAAHMVPLPDFSASVTESEDDVVSMSSSLVGDGTWEDNWLFKKKRSTLQSSATPSSIGMLVPAPKENVRAQIGDRTADEVSDLSEMGSDAEESSLDLLRCNELNDRLLSKHLIGGQNTKLVLDELVDRTSLTSNTLPAEHEPAFTETTNPLVQQPTVATVPQPEEQKTSSTLMAPPPPMIFQDDEITEDPAQTLIAAAQCDSDELCDLEGLTGFGDVEYLDDSKLHENIPSVIEILAAIALGPMLAVPASEQPAVMTATEIHTLKELSDLALAEINARTMELAQHSLDIIEEEFTEAQSADQVDKSQTAVEEHKHMSPVNASEIPSTTTEEISQPKEGNVEVVGQTELSPNEQPISGETPTAAPLINEIASAGLNSETKLVPQEDLAQLVTQVEVIVEPQTAAPAPTITQATEEVTLTAAATEPPTQQLEVSSPLAAGTVASEEAPVPTAEIATLDAHEEDTTLTGETAAPVEIPEPVIELFSPTEKPTTSEAPEDVIVTPVEVCVIGIVTLDEISAASGNIAVPAAEIVTPAEGTIAPEVDPASAEEHAAQPTASEIVSPAEVTATSEEPSWPAAEIVILDTPEEVPTLTGETAAPVEISEPVIELFTPAEKPVTSEPPADVTASSTEESSIPEKVPTPAVKKVAPSEVTAAPDEVPLPTVEIVSPATVTAPEVFPAPAAEIVIAAEGTATPGEIPAPTDEIVNVAEQTAAPEESPTAAVEKVTPAEVTAALEEVPVPAAEIVTPAEVTAPDEPPAPALKILTPSKVTPSEEVPVPAVEIVTPAEVTASQEVTVPADEIVTPAEVTAAPEESPTAAVEKVTPAEVTAAPEEVPEPAAEIVTPAEVTASEDVPEPALEIVTPAEVTAAPEEVPVPASEIVTPAEVTAAPEESPTAAVEKVTPAEVTAAPEEVPVPASEIVTPAQVTPSEEVPVPAVEIVTPAEVTASQEVTVPADEIVTPAEVTAAPEESPTAAVEKVTPAEVTAAPEEVPVPASEIVTPAEVTASEEVPAPAVEIVTPAEVTASQKVLVPAAEIVTPAEGNVAPEEVPVPAEVPVSEESQAPAVEIVTPAEVTAAPEEVPEPAVGIVTPEEVAVSQESPAPAVEIVTSAEGNVAAEVDPAPTEEPAAQASASEIVILAEFNAASEEYSTPAAAIGTFTRVTDAHEAAPVTADKVIAAAGAVTTASEEIPNSAVEEFAGSEVTSLSQAAREDGRVPAINEVARAEDSLEPQVEPKEAAVEEASAAAPQAVLEDAPAPIIKMEASLITIEEGISTELQVVTNEAHDTPEEGPVPIEDVASNEPKAAHEEVAARSIENAASTEITPGPQINFEKISASAINEVTSTDPQTTIEEASASAIEEVESAEITLELQVDPGKAPAPATDDVALTEMILDKPPAPATEEVGSAEITLELQVDSGKAPTPEIEKVASTESKTAPEEDPAQSIEGVGSTEITQGLQVDPGEAPAPAIEEVASTEPQPDPEEGPGVEEIPSSELAPHDTPDEAPTPASDDVALTEMILDKPAAPATEEVVNTDPQPAPEEDPAPTIEEVGSAEITQGPQVNPEEALAPAIKEVVITDPQTTLEEASAPTTEEVVSSEPQAASEEDSAVDENPTAEIATEQQAILHEAPAPEGYEVDYTQAQVTSDQDPAIVIEEVARAEVTSELQQTAVPRIVEAVSSVEPQAALEDASISAIEEVASTETIQEPQVVPGEAQEPAIKEVSLVGNKSELPDAPVEDVPGIEKVANAEIIIPQQEVETPALGNVPPAGVSTKPQADLMEGGFEEVSAVPQVASEEAAATIATDILILEAGDETQADLLTSESVKSDNCALGSIAEREVRKWSNAVEMPNNPYAPEALKQRISGTQERFMDVPNISACAEQKALAMMRGSDEEPASRVEDYKRYSRDYYINNAPQVTTPTSARAASVACSSTEEPASAQTDEDIVINEAQKASKTAVEQTQLVEIPDDKCIYTALPAQVLEAGCNASLETQSNQSLQTTSDDSDTVRVYDFNKQETTVIKAQEQQPSTSSTSSMESALSAPSSSIDASRKRERPVVLQFGPADATPNVCASPSMTPTRGSTPPAFRFLQPKRRLIEPSQVLSIDDDDEMPEPAATPTEKPAVEDDVVHALPSVKALAQAFLLTSKRTQPERRWRAKTLQNAKLRASPDASEQPTSPQSRKHMLQRAVSIAEVADESTIASDLSSLETDPSMQSEENAMNIPIASPASPVPVRRGFLRSNIAYFENLKFK